MGGEIEFDWDLENTLHLKRHGVSPQEFEEILAGDPIYLDYQTELEEERFKVLGATNAGRVLIAVWTFRNGRVRALTAYRAGRSYQKVYWENCK